MAASTQRPDDMRNQHNLARVRRLNEYRHKGSEAAQIRGWPLNCDVLPLNIKGGLAPAAGRRPWPL